MKRGYFGPICLVVSLLTLVMLVASCGTDVAPKTSPFSSPSSISLTTTATVEPTSSASATPSPTPTPAPSTTQAPTQMQTPTYTAPTTPPVLVIPSATLNSHFGGGDTDDAQEVADLGIKWEQGTSLFSWYVVEREKGKYDWSAVDHYVQQVQQYGFASVPTIWPFTDWDQANWAPLPTKPLGTVWERGKGRRKPYDMNAYMSFVSTMVERYDGDGRNDMPGLKYPIKYWEPCDEPHLKAFFDGTPQDYLEVLQATYKAIKTADPEAKVLFAAVDLEGSFIKPILENGSAYFDIANVHSLSNSVNLWVPELRNLLSSYGINKPIWVTAAEFQIGRDTCVSPESQGQLLAKGSVTAFAYGADKIFYDWFRAPLTGNTQWDAATTARFQSAALIDENGVKRPAYYALVTMIKKLEYSTAAEKLSEGRFRFTVGGKTVYAMWGAGALPDGVTGDLIVTDIYGKETRVNSSALNLTNDLVFVEIASGTH